MRFWNIKRGVAPRTMPIPSCKWSNLGKMSRMISRTDTSECYNCFGRRGSKRRSLASLWWPQDQSVLPRCPFDLQTSKWYNATINQIPTWRHVYCSMSPSASYASIMGVSWEYPFFATRERDSSSWEYRGSIPSSLREREIAALINIVLTFSNKEFRFITLLN